MSSQNNETEPVAEPEITEELNRGKKRTAPDSASDKPPRLRKKYAKRAEVWQHFVQREDDPSVSNCKYCGLEIGCDSSRVGTSSMKGHIGRCKMFKDFDEKEKQKVLSSDKGNMRVVKYDPHLFRRSVNELVVMNELPFTFVESEGWKRFCFNVLPLYKTFSQRTCCRDIVGIYEQEKTALMNLFSVENKECL